MPVYEYHCSACGHRTDILHGISESGPKFCPSCGAEGTMRKAFAPPAIVFKGSGWAKKERHAASGGAKKSTSGSESSSSDGDAKSSDTSTGADKPKPAASSGD